MRLPLSTGYALRALLYLARQPAGKRVPSQTIAAAEGIPAGFVLKALRPLVHAGILRSLKGRQGGYSLRRPPEEIPLLEAVEAAHGPVRGDAPDILEDHDDEGRKLQQRLQAVCDEAARVEREVLAGVTVADLVDRPRPSRKR